MLQILTKCMEVVGIIAGVTAFGLLVYAVEAALIK